MWGLLIIQVVVTVFLWHYIANRVEELSLLEKNNVKR